MIILRHSARGNLFDIFKYDEGTEELRKIEGFRHYDEAKYSAEKLAQDEGTNLINYCEDMERMDPEVQGAAEEILLRAVYGDPKVKDMSEGFEEVR